MNSETNKTPCKVSLAIEIKQAWGELTSGRRRKTQKELKEIKNELIEQWLAENPPYLAAVEALQELTRDL